MYLPICFTFLLRFFHTLANVKGTAFCIWWFPRHRRSPGTRNGRVGRDSVVPTAVARPRRSGGGDRWTSETEMIYQGSTWVNLGFGHFKLPKKKDKEIFHLQWMSSFKLSKCAKTSWTMMIFLGATSGATYLVATHRQDLMPTLQKAGWLDPWMDHRRWLVISDG